MSNHMEAHSWCQRKFIGSWLILPGALVREMCISRKDYMLRDSCERCGFVPIDMCQLDVVHIDGCDENDDPSNYMTLCANCESCIIAMSDDELSLREREILRDSWRQGKLFN